MTSPLARHWHLDPNIVFLNHGSFGATPTRVLGAQQAWRERLENDPIRFFVEHHEGAMDAARRALAEFLRCEWDALALLPNATMAVATVFAHLRDTGFLRADDEVLVPDHEYPACQNNARHFAGLCGAQVVAAPLAFPLPRDARATEHTIVASILAHASHRTRVVLLSHVTSPTGLIMPVERIVHELRHRLGEGVRIIIDGAHGVGFVPSLAPSELGCDYYTSNCHKWLCSPKGSAFLWVREELREGLRPLALSNSAERPRAGRAQFLTEFDYLGTTDCTALYCIPDAVQTMGAMMPGGWAEVMKNNRALCLHARDVLCAALNIQPTAPDAMVGCICSIVLPEHPPALAERLRQRPSRYGDALQDALLDRWRIQVPVWNWTLATGNVVRILRVSAQAYNSIGQYQYLAGAVREELGREAGA
jgi:isopenicillin-N epimerase